jgi:hypothetical protein
LHRKLLRPSLQFGFHGVIYSLVVLFSAFRFSVFWFPLLKTAFQYLASPHNVKPAAAAFGFRFLAFPLSAFQYPLFK